MNENVISISEAIQILNQTIGKSVSVVVQYGGSLRLELGEVKDGQISSSPEGEYTLTIDGNWSISDSDLLEERSDDTGSKDSDRVSDLIGKTSIEDFEVVENMKVFTVKLANGKMINITSSTDSLDYLYFTDSKPNSDILALTSEFQFIKKPRN